MIIVPKRVSSKIPSYIQSSQSSQNQTQEREEGSLVADLARGFLQAQAKMSSNQGGKSQDQEIVTLLNKINNQLENMQTSLTNSAQTCIQQQDQGQGQQQEQGQQQGKEQQQSQGQQMQDDVSKELKTLFSKLLTDGGQSSNDSKQSGDGSSDQQKNDQSQSKYSEQGGSVAVQTAAQVLAQAQYELSNELEASLKKLKQVISESEKIANKISTLLGEENTQK